MGPGLQEVVNEDRARAATDSLTVLTQTEASGGRARMPETCPPGLPSSRPQDNVKHEEMDPLEEFLVAAAQQASRPAPARRHSAGGSCRHGLFRGPERGSGLSAVWPA